MALYRGKRVNAVQWYPPGDPKHAGSHPDVEILYRGDRTTFHAAYLKSQTARAGIVATVPLKPGDWLVTARSGRTMIFKPDAFEDLYEPIP